MSDLNQNTGFALWRWYLLALVVVVLDLGSKWLAEELLIFGQPVVITSFFNFTLLYNTGAAFSFLSDAGGWQRWFFGIIAMGVSVAICIWLARLERNKFAEALALSWILGGAIGNLYDRMTLGHVVDFIVLHAGEHYWPAFNIADMAICGGAGLLIWDMYFGARAKEAANDRENQKK